MPAQRRGGWRQNGGTMDIVSRVKNILTTPKTEWSVIAGETADIGSLYLGYIAPLSAIGTIIGLVVALIFFGTAALGTLLASTVLGYLFGLIAIFVIALIL